MNVDRLLWTRPALEVLRILADLAEERPVDPWPHAWPYTPLTAPTAYLPVYERKEQ